MKIRGFPFSFVVEGDPTSGARAELGLHIAQPITDEAFDQLRCVVSWYAKLAALGGLGGATLPPERSTAILGNGDEPDTRGPQPVWVFDTLCVDPKSMVILANLIFATGLRVEQAWLRTTGPTSSEEYAADDYPGEYPQISFSVEDTRADRNVEVTIDFANRVPDNQQQPISDLLRVWSLVGALGGFRQPGPLREKVDLLPEADPEIILDQLTFSLRDEGLHDGAYSVLVNTLIRVNSSGNHLTQVRIR